MLSSIKTYSHNPECFDIHDKMIWCCRFFIDVIGKYPNKPLSVRDIGLAVSQVGINIE